MPGGMEFSRGWDFDPGNKVVTVNDIRDDDEIRALLAGLGDGLPPGGSTGQVLGKLSAMTGAYAWVNPTVGGGSGLPAGGTTGQVLAKTSNADNAVAWSTLPAATPSGGSTGQVLTKNTGATGDFSWVSPVVGLTHIKNITENMTVPMTDFIGSFTITADGTSDGSWPNRFEIWFAPQAGSPRRTFYLNEFGEARTSPAKNNTVPMRLFSRELPTDPAHDVAVPLFEIMDDRTNRNVKYRVYQDGTVEALNVKNRVVTVPTGTTGFATQPDGTLWVEYTP